MNNGGDALPAESIRKLERARIRREQAAAWERMDKWDSDLFIEHADDGWIVGAYGDEEYGVPAPSPATGSTLSEAIRKFIRLEEATRDA